MATRITDILNNSVRAVSHNLTAATTNNTAGSSADFVNAENPFTLFCHVVAATTTPNTQIKVQESTDGTTWADISGASIAAATTSGVSAVTGVRSLQYLRTYNTMGSSGAIGLVTHIIAPLKQSP